MRNPHGNSRSLTFPLLALWLALAVVLLLSVGAAILASAFFSPERPAATLPILLFSAMFTAVGLIALSAIPLVERSWQLIPRDRRRLLVLVFTVGLGLRLLLLASEPILEVDFYRYLWDGALTAHGHNPYAVAPASVAALPYDDPRLELSKAASAVFERISYPELKTIYPPVAQAAFALAHLIGPWSLEAWRLVCIAADVGTFAMIAALLAAVGRSPLWVALYWWNPLVLKEIVNSAHMEAILLPLVLGALLLTIRGRHLAAVVCLGLAFATKLWPIMLVPLAMRPLLASPSRLLLANAALIAIIAGAVLPVWLGGLDETSGFVGFANHWTTNSALFPALQRGVAALVGDAESNPVLSGRIVRGGSAGAVLAFAIWSAWPPLRDARDLVSRAYRIVTLLLLLSPAQFPWYVLWVLPLAITQPGIGWHVAAAIMPLYYSAFHLLAIGAYWVFEAVIVWMIWVPVWFALARDAARARTREPGEAAPCSPNASP